MISGGDLILAGVSGGADSVCLLLILSKLSEELGCKLAVAHIHHGMRESADNDAAYVEELCKELDIPFFLEKVDMAGYAKENGLSREEAGRLLRYRAFENILKKIREEEAAGNLSENVSVGAFKVALAHNMDDRAETLLFNLFRGSGLKGLGSIRPVRDNVIRPLLCLTRKEIETYLEQEKIGFCIDETNEDEAYTRNRIRRHILPFANEQICKKASVHTAQAAEDLSRAHDFIQKQGELAYERCLLGRSETRLELGLDNFLKEEEFLRNIILLRCMEELTPHGKDITREHIEALLKISSKEGSGRLSLPYGLEAYKEYDRLVIFKKAEETGIYGQNGGKHPPIRVRVPGTAAVEGVGTFEFKYLDKKDFFYKKGQIIPEKTYTKWFDCDKITKALVLRTRESGDYLTIDAALNKKAVKEYMINEKISRVKRDNIYMLADGPHILWIPDYRISQYYKVDENTKRILQVHLKKDELEKQA